MMTSEVRIKVRTTQACRVGLDLVAAGSIIEVDPAHAAQLIHARRAKLLDFADLRVMLAASSPTVGADVKQLRERIEALAINGAHQ